MVNVLKEIMDQVVTEINSDCGPEHKKSKYRLTVDNELVQKRERAVIPKMIYSEIKGGGGNSLQTTLHVLHEKPCMGQV